MTSFSREFLIFTFFLSVFLINNESLIYGVQIPSNSTTNTTTIPLTTLSDKNIKNISRCSPISDVPNGKLRFSNSLVNNTYIHGTIATLSCNSGYQHIGDLIATCREGTNWTKIGNCVKTDSMDCRPMNVSHDNGYIIYVSSSIDQLMKKGTIAKLVCNSKSKPTGVTEINCTSNGWDNNVSFGKCSLKTSDDRLKRDSDDILKFNTQITCPQLIIDHGAIQYYHDGITNNGNYPQGTTAILSCESGYEPVGVTSCMCSSGVWNPAIGSCRLITNINLNQQIPTIVPPGIATRKRRQVTLPSIIGIGTTTGLCYLPMPFVLGGTISYSNNQIFPPFTSGTVATLTCSNGAVQGISTATCNNGSWSSSSLGTCNTTSNIGISGLSVFSQSSCTLPVGSGLGGSITYTQGASYGPFPHMTIATLTCDLGATVSGTSTTTCMNGVWTPSTLGTCVSSGSNNLLGSTSMGLNNIITPTLTSTTNDQCFSGVIDPLNGRITYSNGASFGPFPAGTVATLTCNDGYVPLAPFISTCTSGVFSPQATVPTCVTSSLSNGTGQLNGSCFALAAPLSGTIEYSLPISSTTQQYPAGTVATLICNSGFIASGTISSTCNSSGWTPFGLGTYFEIKKINCLSIGEIENGVITYEGEDIYKKDNLYPHGTTAYLFCYFNYNPIGFGKTSCNNGKWKPKNIGKCIFEKKKCDEIIIDGNNNFEGVLLKYLNEYVEIKCDYGYQLNGIKKIKCLKNGEWDIDIKKHIFCTKIKSKNETKEFQNTLKKTKNIYNHKPCITPWDGNSLYNYKYSEIFLSHSLLKNGMLPHNTYISLKCKNSQLHGSNDSYCVDGNWFPHLGICKIIEEKKFSSTSCQEISIPKNGIIKFIESSKIYNNEIGTYGVLHCEKGYRIKGNPLVTCTINGWVPITGLGNCEILLR
ncbi:Sushi/SCR/CCP domain-containing protein [Strongyloides ratti]|uniref:Sushi/SCR/CCP domain-containing protein n=1 Tax=Strongyloides ratti TaxID=34506 RepID=A0A090MXN4_STRRB|nr:Sushi/SCR/CCP domain-containing protein [Strongyloides ratti]CEF65739.1 Sushi/SCR/CCP domain-containing protein [Strongyloides ratti]